MPNYHICKFCAQPSKRGRYHAACLKRPAIYPIGPSIAYLPSSKEGVFARISAWRSDELSKHLWHARYDASVKGYYFSRSGSGEKWLHRIICGARKDEISDHISGDTIDCCDWNIRAVDKFQSSYNRKTRSDNTSGQKGVSWYPTKEKWIVRISVNGRRKCLGYHSSFEESCRIYKEASLKFHGDFSR